MIYFESKDIQVFPSAYRGNYTKTEVNVVETTSKTTSFGFDPEAELNTEFNYTHLMGLSGDKDSYIIQWPTEDSDLTICVIKGYYFKITGLYKQLKNVSNDDYSFIVCLKTADIANAYSTIESKRTTTVLYPLDGEGGNLLDKADGTDNSKYIFIGLGLVSSTEAKTEAYTDGDNKNYYYLKLGNVTSGTTTWDYSSQVSQSFQEGTGKFAIVQKAEDGVAGQATGSSTVILGKGHDIVSSDYALVTGRYSKRPEEAEAEELFTVGAGSSTEAKNAFQVTVDENSKVQAVVSGNIKASDNIKADKNIEASENLKATNDVWVGKTIYFGKTEGVDSKGHITIITKDDEAAEAAEVHNVTFPDEPTRDYDPIRLKDLLITEEFFEALYK